MYARYQLINELSRAVFAYQRELEVAIVAVALAPPHPNPPPGGTGAKAKGRSVNVAASSGRREHPRAERTLNRRLCVECVCVTCLPTRTRPL